MPEDEEDCPFISLSDGASLKLFPGQTSTAGCLESSEYICSFLLFDLRSSVVVKIQDVEGCVTADVVRKRV